MTEQIIKKLGEIGESVARIDERTKIMKGVQDEQTVLIRSANRRLTKVETKQAGGKSRRKRLWILLISAMSGLLGWIGPDLWRFFYEGF